MRSAKHVGAEPARPTSLSAESDRFLRDVDYKSFPAERHTLLVGKFLEVGQMRKDFVPEIEKTH